MVRGIAQGAWGRKLVALAVGGLLAQAAVAAAALAPAAQAATCTPDHSGESVDSQVTRWSKATGANSSGLDCVRQPTSHEASPNISTGGRLRRCEQGHGPGRLRASRSR